MVQYKLCPHSTLPSVSTQSCNCQVKVEESLINLQCGLIPVSCIHRHTHSTVLDFCFICNCNERSGKIKGKERKPNYLFTALPTLGGKHRSFIKKKIKKKVLPMLYCVRRVQVFVRKTHKGSKFHVHSSVSLMLILFSVQANAQHGDLSADHP